MIYSIMNLLTCFMTMQAVLYFLLLCHRHLYQTLKYLIYMIKSNYLHLFEKALEN